MDNQKLMICNVKIESQLKNVASDVKEKPKKPIYRHQKSNLK